MSRAEEEILGALDEEFCVPLGHAAYVAVKQIEPGVRERRFFTAPGLHRPEKFGDTAAQRLWEWENYS